MKQIFIFLTLTITLLISLSCSGGGSATITSEDSTTTLEVRGKVTDLVDSEQKSVTISLSGNSLGTTDESGTFSISLEEGEHTLAFSKSGYTTAYAQVYIGTELPDSSEATLLIPSGENNPEGQEGVNGTVSVVLKPTQNLSLSGSQSITLSKTGSSVTTQKVFNFESDKVFTRIKNKAGVPVKRKKYEGASLDFSKIDPTRELNAMPGPLSAQDSTYQQSKARFKGRQTAENENVGLESVTMMDLTLRDSEGNAIQMDEGDSLESFVRLPDRDQDNYREAYERGERVIPWYSFDPDLNSWVREGEAELVNIDDEMYARADVTHFSWWNLDIPRERGRLQGKVRDTAGNPFPGIEVVIEAIGTSFRTSTITDSDGNYSFRILRNSKAKVYVKKDGIQSIPVTLNFDDSPETSPHIQDLTYETVLLSGLVVSDIGTPLPGALIKLPSGQGIYTDSNGSFGFQIGKGGALKLTTQYTQGDLNFITKSQLSSDNLLTDFNLEVVVDLNNIIQVTGQVRLDGSGIPNANIYTLNGERTQADSNGVYSFSVSKTAGASSQDFAITLKAFYFDEASSSFPELSYTIPINEGATNIVQNFDFSPSEKVELIGRVLVDGIAKQSVEIYCDNGCLTLTDSDGLYSIEGYVGQTLKIYAITTDLSNQPIRLEQELTLFETDSGINQADNFEFILPQATITGTVSIDMGNGQTLGLGAVKIISENGVQKQSASNGAYRFTLAPEVSNTLWFEVETPSGLVSIEKEIEALEIDEVKTLNVSFDRSDIVNLSPILEEVDVSSFKVESGDNVQITVTASDPDAAANELLTFEALSQDTTLATISKTGDVSTPGNSNRQVFTFQAGSQTGWVETQLSISDGENIITRSVYIEIVEQIINNPPSLLALQAPTKVQSKGRYEITYLVHDPEGDKLTYDFTITPNTGLSIQEMTKEIRNISGITETQNANNRRLMVLNGATVGTIYTISANVSDGTQNLITTQAFEVVDEAPIFKSFSPELDLLPYSDTDIAFSAQAEDPEGDSLTYAWSLKIGEGSFSNVASTANFNFNPTKHLSSSANLQQLTFLVSVSDGTNTTEKQKTFYVLPADRELIKEPVAIQAVWNDKSQIDIGDSISYSVSLTYNTGETEDISTSVTVSGFNSSALTQNLNTMTALDDGSYLIQFKYNSNGFSFEDSLNLTVNPPFLTALWATLSEATLVIGESLQVMLTAVFDNGDKIDVTSDGNSQYFSSEEGVASFSSNQQGLLTGHNVGSTTLSLSYTDVNNNSVAQTTKEIEVEPIQLESFAVFPTHLNMVVGESYTLTGNATYNNGNTQTVQNFHSTSDNPDVAIVNEDNIVFPTGAGNTSFVHTYKENGIEKQSTTTISVTLPVPEIVRLKVSPEDAELILGKTLDLNVFAIYNTGTIEEIDNTSMSMSANLGTFANGTFTPTELGTTKLTFTLGDQEVSCDLTIVNEPNEATITQISKIGGAAYKVAGLKREIGGEEVDLIVYSDYKTLNSVLVNDPDQPVILDELILSRGYIYDFQQTENYIHLATGYDGYSMVTYDNPSSLEIPKGYRYTLDGWSRKVFTQKVGDSRFAYLLSEKGWSSNGRRGINGVIILDITNPRNISQVGKIKLDGRPSCMAYSNGKLYVATHPSWQYDFSLSSWSYSAFRGISEIDVNNPNQAVVLNSYSTNSYIYSLAIKNNSILVGEGNSLKVYALDSILSSPLKSIILNGYIREIASDEKGYLISLGYGGVARVTDIDNQFQLSYLETPPKPDWQPTFSPLDPDEEDEQPSSVTSAEVYSATQINNILYLANGFNGLGIIPEESNGLGVAKAGLPNLGYTSQIQTSDNLLFAASREKGIVALNIENPLVPTKLGEYKESGYYISKLFWEPQSQTLFAHLYSYRSYWWWSYYGGNLGASPHKIVALKWTNNKLTLIDTQVTQGWVNAMDFSLGKLYMIANDFKYYNFQNNSEIQSLEWANNSFGEYQRQTFQDFDSTVKLKTQKTSSQSITYLRTLKASEKLIAIGSYYGTYFYNHNLERVSSLTSNDSHVYRYPNGYHFVYNGDLVINSYGYLHYIDLNQPTSPKKLSSIYAGYGRAFDGLGNMVMLGGYWGNLKLVSFKEPNSPQIIPTSEYTSPKYLQFLQWNGNHVYLGSGWNGVYILEVKVPKEYYNFNPVAILPSKIFTTANSNVLLNASNSYDIEGDGLNYQWSAYSDMANTSANQLLSNTDQVTTVLSFGTDPIEIHLQVSDFGGSDTTQTQIILNTAPIVSAGNDIRFVSSSNLQFDGSYVDPDNNITSIFWTQIAGETLTLSDNSILNPTITGTLTNDIYTFRLSVSDDFTSDFDDVSILRNKPPIFTIDGLNETGFGDNVILSVNNIVDLDGDALTFDWSVESAFQIEQSSTDNIISLITPAAVGNIIISVTINDGYETYTTSHTLAISGDNFPPEIQFMPNILTQRNQTLSITASVTDLNNDPLTYFWEEVNSDNLIITNNTNMVADITTPNYSNNVMVRLSVNDGNVVVFKEFAININEKPQIFTQGNQTVFHTDTIYLSADAYDAEYALLIMNWQQTSGTNLEYIDQGNSIVVTPPGEDALLEFEVSTTDGIYDVTEIVSVNVIYNFPPEILSVSGNNFTMNAGNVFLVADTFDIDQDSMNYSWIQISGPTLSLGNTSDNILTAYLQEGGTYQFIFNTSDAYFSSNQIVEVFYNELPPVIVTDNVITTQSGADVNLNASLSYDPEGKELSFIWQQIAGTNLTLNGETTNTLNFTPGSGSGNYEFLLTVNDGEFSSNTLVLVNYDESVNKLIQMDLVNSDSLLGIYPSGSNVYGYFFSSNFLFSQEIDLENGRFKGNETLIQDDAEQLFFGHFNNASIEFIEGSDNYFLLSNKDWHTFGINKYLYYFVKNLSSGNIDYISPMNESESQPVQAFGNVFTTLGNTLHKHTTGANSSNIIISYSGNIRITRGDNTLYILENSDNLLFVNEYYSDDSYRRTIDFTTNSPIEEFDIAYSDNILYIATGNKHQVNLYNLDPNGLPGNPTALYAYPNNGEILDFRVTSTDNIVVVSTIFINQIGGINRGEYIRDMIFDRNGNFISEGPTYFSDYYGMDSNNYLYLDDINYISSIKLNGNIYQILNHSGHFQWDLMDSTKLTKLIYGYDQNGDALIFNDSSINAQPYISDFTETVQINSGSNLILNMTPSVIEPVLGYHIGEDGQYGIIKVEQISGNTLQFTQAYSKNQVELSFTAPSTPQTLEFKLTAISHGIAYESTLTVNVTE